MRLKMNRTDKVVLAILGLALVGMVYAALRVLLSFLGTTSEPLVVGLDIGAVIADLAILGLILWEDFLFPFLCGLTPLSRNTLP